MEDLFSAFANYLLKSENKKIRTMLDDGFDPNMVDPRNGNTALKYISAQGNCEVLRMFVEKGADVNQKIFYKSTVGGREEFGYTPVFYVFGKKMLKELISYGADINTRAEDGKTALMRFSNWTNSDAQEIIKVLLSEGADTSIKDVNGQTALDICEKKNNILTVSEEKYRHIAEIHGIGGDLHGSNEILRILREHEI